MNKIKELRKTKGLTQIQFCQQMNIGQATLSGWECGKWEPDNKTLIKLADFFGVSVDYLLGRENKNLIERPPYEITDKQTLDVVKLFKYMNDIQKAQVLGYAVALLEQVGVNVAAVLNG